MQENKGLAERLQLFIHKNNKLFQSLTSETFRCTGLTSSSTAQMDPFPANEVGDLDSEPKASRACAERQSGVSRGFTCPSGTSFQSRQLLASCGAAGA